MNRLPAEALAEIITHASAPSSKWLDLANWAKPWQDWAYDEVSQKQVKYTHSIARYATVSRAWQPHIERLIFAKLYLSPARMAAAKEILTLMRLGYVRSLDLEVVLDPYDDEATMRLENTEEKQRNNEVFTRTVAQLFSLLKPLDTSAFPSRRSLHLSAYSPSDGFLREDMARLRYRRRMGIIDNMMEVRYQQSYLELLDTPGLVLSLGIFSEFKVPSPFSRSLQRRLISPSACCRIAAQLHGVEEIDWHLSDNEKKDVALRRRLRDDFAKGLPLLPKSLRHVVLEYPHESPRNHDFSSSDILDKANPTADPLSVALRQLSKRLVSADLRGISLTADFFKSSSTSDGRKELWPQLKALTVYMSAVEPTGEWLLDRHVEYRPSSSSSSQGPEPWDRVQLDEPADEDEEVNEFRGSPRARLREQFIEAGRSAKKMPALQDLYIHTGCEVPTVNIKLRSYLPYCSLRYSVASRSLKIESLPMVEVDGDLGLEWRLAAEKHLGNGDDLSIESVETRCPVQR